MDVVECGEGGGGVGGGGGGGGGWVGGGVVGRGGGGGVCDSHTTLPPDPGPVDDRINTNSDHISVSLPRKRAYRVLTFC